MEIRRGLMTRLASHLPLAVVNPGDVVLVPQPGYPVYQSASLFAGGEPHIMPLEEANGYLPDLAAIPEDVAKRARLMYVNYPNNPTAAVAGKPTCEGARSSDGTTTSSAARLSPTSSRTHGAKTTASSALG